MHWFFDPGLTEQSSALPDSESKHARSLRINDNELISITNGSGALAVARFRTDQNSYEIESFSHRIEKGLDFHLIQALAKNDRDEMALQASVELGVRSVIPWQAERSIVRWDQKADRNRERWQMIAIEAMKQSQQTLLCEVSAIAKTSELTPIGMGLVLDPRADVSIGEVGPAPSYTLVVGPEGGISNSELETLHSKGFRSVRLGDSILRASTAGPAAIAALQTLHGSFRS